MPQSSWPVEVCSLLRLRGDESGIEIPQEVETSQRPWYSWITGIYVYIYIYIHIIYIYIYIYIYSHNYIYIWIYIYISRYYIYIYIHTFFFQMLTPGIREMEPPNNGNFQRGNLIRFRGHFLGCGCGFRYRTAPIFMAWYSPGVKKETERLLEKLHPKFCEWFHDTSNDQHFLARNQWEFQEMVGTSNLGSWNGHWRKMTDWQWLFGVDLHLVSLMVP